MPPTKEPMRYLMRLHVYNKNPHFGKGMVRLMSLIKEGHSLRSACREMNLAYSKAWKMIKAAEDDLGVAVIAGSAGGKGGGGSSLTDDGEALLARFLAFESEAKESLDALFNKHFCSLE